MQNWTKKHARFVGRVIFANFLNFPLETYKNIIKEVEQSIYYGNYNSELLTTRILSKANIAKNKNRSSKVIAEIVKSGKKLSIRYTYNGFNKIYLIDKFFENTDKYGLERGLTQTERSFLFRLRRIGSRNELTHRVIKEIIEHQKKYLSTGNLIDLIPFSQTQLDKRLSKNQSPKIDISWISRLVNRISIIIPSGDEKALKSFFQTQKDINKRFIKLLLDRENEDIESGRIPKPLTDTLIKNKLKREYGINISRYSVGLCRKDIGIPNGRKRPAGYKYPPILANFSMLYPLVPENIVKYTPSNPGIYEFRLKGKEIEYPNSKTYVIYIGSTRNIRKRLRDHLCKNNKNGHIKYFLNNFRCFFRYIQFPKKWREEERRLFNLFVTTYGAPPKCNKVRP